VESGERLEALSLARLREFYAGFKPDVSKYISVEACVERRLSPGGTSSRRVSEAIQQAKRTLQRP
jgi:argininosuccinate lyase